MRTTRRRASVIAALSAAALFAGAGAAQAATGYVDVHGINGEGNVTNPKNGKCYNVSDGYNSGRLLMTNHTDRTIKVYYAPDCKSEKPAVVKPGATYRASESWGFIFYSRSFEVV
ncbi:hypothetical protein [Streptomyces sp. NPDC052496]|uniref:hypothetical protein n=1 Tax=Streptomyces sp. NPDC052496 TaxID=3154951 RepID=UPI00344383B7